VEQKEVSSFDFLEHSVRSFMAHVHAEHIVQDYRTQRHAYVGNKENTAQEVMAAFLLKLAEEYGQQFMHVTLEQLQCQD
jgi:uncharacterized protein YmfQ (DUF2313 family)